MMIRDLIMSKRKFMKNNIILMGCIALNNADNSLISFFVIEQIALILLSKRV